MKRHNIEFLWAWFDALRRRDTDTMAAALDPNVVWQGIREDLVCNGPEDVVAGFVAGYDANQEIDSLELLGGERHIVLGVHGPDLGEIDDVQIGPEMYNVFTIDHETITRIEDYLRSRRSARRRRPGLEPPGTTQAEPERRRPRRGHSLLRVVASVSQVERQTTGRDEQQSYGGSR